MKKLIIVLLCILTLTACSSTEELNKNVSTEVTDIITPTTKTTETIPEPTNVVEPTEYTGEYYRVKLIIKDTFGNILNRNDYMPADVLRYTIPEEYICDKNTILSKYTEELLSDETLMNLFALPAGTTYKFSPINEDGSVRPATNLLNTTDMPFDDYKDKTVVDWSYENTPIEGTVEGDCEIVVIIKPILIDKVLDESTEVTEEVTE